ncbi:hypothetical protein G3O06_32080 [Burkholderia sp. Ac-20345]|uniref:hypothetical protein n=1 Tax=Burkholderia sp. Ac-20345 TaxID=2703891 RepID=UPI00197C4932|nr:hypothetical protein [Burkholderia sp. Ac-20345]MBN3782145.1 hypothetical protein [Burkholderia sp. Ac-20345]
MPHVDPVAIVRMVFILFHLLAFGSAAAASVMADYAVFGRGRVDTSLLRRAATGVTMALAVLWITGTAIIWLDTKFDLVMITKAPKLLAKLTIVSLLTLNGMALHWLAFPRLEKVQNNPNQAAYLPAILGAISSTTWLFSAFLGIAKAVAPLLGYSGFIALYMLALGCAVTTALLVVRPLLAKRIGRQTGIPLIA